MLYSEPYKDSLQERTFEMNIDMKISLIKVEKIKPADFEPPARLTRSALSTLKRQIESIGQILQPLVLDERYNLIDGHRRLACAKILDMKVVPTRIIHGTEEEVKRAFVILNEPVRKLTSAEATYVYLKDGAVSEKDLLPIVWLEKLIGRSELERAVLVSPNGRLSANSIRIMVTQLKKTVGDKGDEFFSKAAKWLIFQNQSFYLRTAIYSRMNTDLILSAIETNTSLY
jgi:ParB-like nuclease family protein